ncbi:hypothetical protein HDU96_009770, partial [Phlyctochytrium bullatum]
MTGDEPEVIVLEPTPNARPPPPEYQNPPAESPPPSSSSMIDDAALAGTVRVPNDKLKALLEEEL